MSTHIPPEVVPVIRDAVSRHPAGATLKDVLAAFPDPPTRRSLQRWLSNLVDAGALKLKPDTYPAQYLLGGAGDPVANPAPPLGHGQPASVANLPGQVPAGAADAEVGHGQPAGPVANRTPLGHGQPPSVANLRGQVTPRVGHGGGEALGQATQAADLSRFPLRGQVTPEVGHGQDDSPNSRGQLAGEGAGQEVGHGQPPAPVANPTPVGHGQPPRPVANLAGQAPEVLDNVPLSPSPPSALRPLPSGSQPAASAQPKPHRRKPVAAGRATADRTDAEPAEGSAEAAVADVAADLVARVLGHRPKSGEPVRKPRRPTLPLLAAGALSAALLGWLGHLTWNVWTLAGLAVLTAVTAGALVWRSRFVGPPSVVRPLPSDSAPPSAIRPLPSDSSAPPSATPDSAAASISAFQHVSMSAFQGRRALCRIAAAGLAAVALVAAFLAYRQFRLRPSIATVQAFVTSRLASQPVRVFALDVTFQAPGGGGVRLTYVAAVDNTAPLYTTEATSVYLQNQPGKLPAALTHTDMLLDGVGGDRLRALVGPPPTPDPRTVLLLKTAVPIGTPAVTSGTLFAWRTDHGWKFTVEGETPPRFAGEPRPTDKPSFVLDDPKDVAALNDLLQRHAAYAAKVQAASVAEQAARSEVRGQTTDGSSVRTADASARAGSRSSQSADTESTERATPTADGGRQRAAGSAANVAAPVPTAVQTDPVSRKESQDAQENRMTDDRWQPAENSPAARPISAFQHVSVSDFPTSSGAYALVDGRWTALPHNHGHTVKNTGLTNALGALAAAEDKLAGHGTNADDIPASSVLATIVYDGTDEIPTLSGTGLILAYVGTLKPMPDAILRNYPLLREYPLMEMARTTTVNGHDEVRMLRIAPGIAAFGPTRIPATLETYGPLTILRPTGPLAPGTYALTCGSDKYELRVND